MALSVTEFSATIGTTEWSLITNTAGPDAETTDRIEQVIVSFHNLAAGDVYRITVYETLNAAARIAGEWFVANVQAQPASPVPPLLLGNGYDVTCTKIAGTDRAIYWTLNRVT